MIKTSKFLLLLFSTYIYGAGDMAIVSKMAGRATKLLPGAISASVIEVGDQIPQDTSIVTGRRSFVTLTLADESKVTIGPKSKMVLSLSAKESGSILSLLKGKMRSQVEKVKKKKLYITTRTAALGVRGTDFQTIYNPENLVTNLLTFNGEVAIAKIKENDIDYKTQTLNSYERTSSNEVKIIKKDYRVPVISTSELDDLIEKKKPEVVKAGQFSGTLGAFEKVSKPVKISPVQLSLLYSNKTLTEPMEVSPRDITDTSGVSLITQAEQEAPLEGFYDANSGDYAPKSGGVIDIETGLYVPPGKNAQFDENKQIYIAKSVGQLDSITGAYVAPKGLKLDATKGFVLNRSLKDKNYLKKNGRKLVVVSRALNNEVKTDLVVTKKEVSESSYVAHTLRERFSKDHIIFMAGSYDLEIDESENSVTSNNNETFSGAEIIKFDWLLKGNGNYRPRLYFSLKGSGSANSASRYSKPGDQQFGLGFGVDFYLTDEVYLSTLIDISEELAPSYSSELAASLTSVAINRFHVGLNYDFYRYKRLGLFTQFHLNTNFHKTDSDLTIKNGFGVYLSLGAQYNLNRRNALMLNLSVKEQRFKVRNNNFNSEVANLQSGARLSYKYSF